MAERSSIFDMLGPIMIGPSSSHTGGVAKIGKTARRIFGCQPEFVTITFYNSFARTYEGHGSDRAILAGLLGMEPDDEKIRDAFTHSDEAGMEYKMKAVFNASSLHPNSIRMVMEKDEKKMSVLGVSRGGGLISIVEIDSYKCNFSAQTPTLILTAEDVSGSIAFISNVVAHDECNIATMTVDRSAKNDLAKLVMELDTNMRELSISYLKSLRWIRDVVYLEYPYLQKS